MSTFPFRAVSSSPAPSFAALPHALRKDPRLRGHHTAIVLAAALLEYARDDSSCWPSVGRLAADLGCTDRTVQRALTALRRSGWFRVDLTEDNPTGRSIVLTWREAGTHPSMRLVLPPVTTLSPGDIRVTPPPVTSVSPDWRSIRGERIGSDRKSFAIPVREPMPHSDPIRSDFVPPSQKSRIPEPIQIPPPTDDLDTLMDRVLDVATYPDADAVIRPAAVALAAELGDGTGCGPFRVLMGRLRAGVVSKRQIREAIRGSDRPDTQRRAARFTTLVKESPYAPDAHRVMTTDERIAREKAERHRSRATDPTPATEDTLATARLWASGACGPVLQRQGEQILISIT